MAIEHVDYALSHNINEDGYEMSTGLPSLIPSEVSMTIVLTVLNDTGDALDCTGATVKIWGRPEDSAVALTLLSTGAVGGGSNNELTFTIAKDTIPAGWALYPGKVMVLYEIEDGTHMTKIIQRNLTVYSEEDDEDIIFPYTEDIALTVESYSAVQTLDGAPGLRVIMCDPGGGGWTLTLCATGTYDGQMLLIHNEDTTNDITLDPDGTTINGVAGNQTIGPLEDLIIWEDGGNWAAYNPRLAIP